jgi:hypothetical protein
MDVTYELTRNGRVFVYHLSGALDLHELKTWTDQWERDILNPAPEPVYFIADFTGITNLPVNMLSGARDMARRPSPNLKLIVFVSNNTFIVKMATMFSRMVSMLRMKVVPTFDAAWAEVDRALANEAGQPQR